MPLTVFHAPMVPSELERSASAKSSARMIAALAEVAAKAKHPIAAAMDMVVIVLWII